MKAQQIVVCILGGCTLLAFGLIPGLLRNLVEGVRNFSDSIGSPHARVQTSANATPQQPAWLAVVGAALLLVGLVSAL